MKTIYRKLDLVSIEAIVTSNDFRTLLGRKSCMATNLHITAPPSNVCRYGKRLKFAPMTPMNCLDCSVNRRRSEIA